MLVDAPPRVREGLRTRLSLEANLEIIGEAGDASHALRLTDPLRPDVVLVNVEATDLDVSALVRSLLAASPGVASHSTL